MPTQLTRADVRITLSQFQIERVLLPAVPTVTQATDQYAVLGPNGLALPVGRFQGRSITYAPTAQEQAGLATFLGAVVTKLQPLLDPVVIANADGSNPQTFDQFCLESPITIQPIFDDQGRLDLKNSFLTVCYSRWDAAGEALDTVNVQQVIGPGGWALNQGAAMALIAAKRARLRQHERFGS